MSSAPPVPKASLYFYKQSVWASVPLLALEEKGYGTDEIDLKEVDLSKGENFTPAYLRINNNATVPTLVVPLENTLDPEIESRYKPLRDTKSIVEFLDKSRSLQSRTHSTSTAPAPSLAPATIAFSSASNKIIELLHSEAGDPNALMFMNAQDDEQLERLTESLKPILIAKCDALDKLIEENKHAEVKVSEKTARFWEMKRVATSMILDVLEDGEKPTSEVDDEAKGKRGEYFKAAAQAWGGLQEVLVQLSKEIIGPYALGDQLSIADLHLAAWLARIAMLSGAQTTDDGGAVISKIEEHVGESFSLPKDFSVAEARRRAGLPASNVPPTERQARLAAFWDAVKERPSWKKVYADGLH
ncbi:uncharacterized protein PHACADRAFT_247441 [Phanerochaete carnosa HHB-10118-sp]|uniref:GST N-terminal domain-containing protein n=1 Tax=Phanerochaete carnosa (strain HHB-10118-sp) TaxID=650164 RepID=K5VDL7_PHACS|nr:uncharacterized protein PHACADRAFT_247441 [Phanerochaete carnosa HHB-10118-sp]EKM61076.1 hypothetical protein PHACADRAFT_247441 [Phanerochaete carnosa HHB-10118-sp]